MYACMCLCVYMYMIGRRFVCGCMYVFGRVSVCVYMQVRTCMEYAQQGETLVAHKRSEVLGRVLESNHLGNVTK